MSVGLAPCFGLALTLTGAACGAPSADAALPQQPSPSAALALPTQSTPSSSSSATPATASVAPPAPVAPPDVVVDARPSAVGAPAALYAQLFSPGAMWQISARYSVTSGMTTPPSSRRTSTRGSCTVAMVENRRWALVSQVTCKDFGAEAALEPNPLSGFWVATASGLFHFAEDPGADAPPLTRSVAVLAAEPSPEHLEHAEPGDRFGPAWSAEVARSGDGWCSSQANASSGPTSVQRCFGATQGFATASASVTSGMTFYGVELRVTRFTPGKPQPPP